MFLNPAAWFLLALALPLLVFHFWRNRAGRLVVPSLLLWKEALSPKSAPSWLGKISRWLSLLLQLAILVLLAGAASLPGEKATTVPQVVILDNRPRMLARVAGGKEAFAVAYALADEVVSRSSARGRVAVLTTSPNPMVAIPFGSRGAESRKGMREIGVAESAGNLDEAIGMGIALLEREGGGELLVITDRQVSLADLPEEVSGRTVGVGGGGSGINAGFVTAAAWRSPAHAGEKVFFFSLANFTREAQEFQVEVVREEDGRILEEFPVAVAAGGIHEETRPLPRFFNPAGAAIPGSSNRLLLRIRDWSDALAQDQEIILSIPSPTLRRVLLVSIGSPFLERLLRVMPGWSMELLLPQEWTPEISESFDLTIFDRDLPENFLPGLPAGKSLLFLGTSPWGKGDALPLPLATSANPDHPVLRGIDLSRIEILEAHVLNPSPPDGPDGVVTGLVGSPDGPLLLAGVETDSRWLALAFSPERSDLPLQLAFPVLFFNAMEWLVDAQGYGFGNPGDGSNGNSNSPDELDLRAGWSSEGLTRYGLPWNPPFWKWAAVLAGLLLIMEWSLWRRNLV